ncbi:hypothetical protein AB1Y20_013847 [Prymnesium parvum]|uniref:Uncharacterized protein n=1 Tax=Prymnesium parvum TaxID=97485 RepID=A0AB34IGN3_PRYPA
MESCGSLLTFPSSSLRRLPAAAREAAAAREGTLARGGAGGAAGVGTCACCGKGAVPLRRRLLAGEAAEVLVVELLGPSREKLCAVSAPRVRAAVRCHHALSVAPAHRTTTSHGRHTLQEIGHSNHCTPPPLLPSISGARGGVGVDGVLLND